MDFKQFIEKKVVLSAMPDLNIYGIVLGFVGTEDDPWMQIQIDSSDKIMDGKIALVDCNMITCIVDVS